MAKIMGNGNEMGLFCFTAPMRAVFIYGSMPMGYLRTIAEHVACWNS